jgi:hypothetical protein
MWPSDLLTGRVALARGLRLLLLILTDASLLMESTDRKGMGCEVNDTSGDGSRELGGVEAGEGAGLGSGLVSGVVLRDDGSDTERMELSRVAVVVTVQVQQRVHLVHAKQLMQPWHTTHFTPRLQLGHVHLKHSNNDNSN